MWEIFAMREPELCIAPSQVLHGGDLICEGVIRALKAAPKAAAAAPASDVSATKEATAEEVSRCQWSTLLLTAYTRIAA